MLPFLALAPGEAWFSIRAQLTRGLQVESLPGQPRARAADAAADKLGLGALGVGVAEGGTGDVRSADVTGALGSVVGALGGARGRRGRRRGLARRVASVRDAGAGSCVTARRSSRPSSRSGGCCRRSSSCGSSRSSRSSRVGAGGCASALLARRARRDALWFPDLYRDYVNERGAPETAYLLGRNALLLALLVVLAARRLRALRSPSSPTAANSTNAGATGTA